MTLWRPTGTPISARNKVMLIRITGANAGKQEAARIAAKNRRNYLSRTRTAAGRWEK